MNFLSLFILINTLFVPFLLGDEHVANAQTFKTELALVHPQVSLGSPFVINIVSTYPKGYVLDYRYLKNQILDRANQFSKTLEWQGDQIEPAQQLQNDLQQQHAQLKFLPLITRPYFLNSLLVRFNSDSEGNSQSIDVLGRILEGRVKLEEKNAKEIFALIAPTLPLVKEMPISISLENRLKWFENRALEEKENIDLRTELEGKRIPFKAITYVLALLGILLFFRKLLLAGLKQLLAWWNRPKDPQEEALKQMIRLEKKQSKEHLSSKTFYICLSDVVRDYVEKKYQLHSRNRSTTEFIHMLAERSFFTPAMRNLLSDFLKNADLVKFANLEPSKEDCGQAFEAVRQFVEKN